MGEDESLGVLFVPLAGLRINKKRDIKARKHMEGQKSEVTGMMIEAEGRRERFSILLAQLVQVASNIHESCSSRHPQLKTT
eukprot:764283-Hanusia_phi.AAC.4